jgi:hypothetical protein
MPDVELIGTQRFVPTTVPGALGAVKRANVSAELFIIPTDDGKFIVYAPLRRAAFVANGALVDFIVRLRETGIVDEVADPGGLVTDFLRNLEIVDGGEEPRPITEFSGDPEPTAVTLFGSERESERGGILGGFLKNDELGPGRGHALGFEQEVAEIPIAAAAA